MESSEGVPVNRREFSVAAAAATAAAALAPRLGSAEEEPTIRLRTRELYEEALILDCNSSPPWEGQLALPQSELVKLPGWRTPKDQDLAEAKLVILPGTKNTMADLEWTRRTGIDCAVKRAAQRGTPIVGICGGYQMLGETVLDPHHVESEHASAEGLGFFAIETELNAAESKRLARTGAWIAAASFGTDDCTTP